MKIIFCGQCKDVFTPQLTRTTCSCGASVGRMKEDGEQLVISGQAFVYNVSIHLLDQNIINALAGKPLLPVGLYHVRGQKGIEWE